MRGCTHACVTRVDTYVYVLLVCKTVRVIHLHFTKNYIRNNVRTLMNKIWPDSLTRILLHIARHNETISLQGAYSSDIISGYSK